MHKNTTETADWPLDRLKPHPSQAGLFQDTPEAEFEELKNDIAKRGLRHPVEALPDGTIICGHRRVRALRLLGRRTVPVLVLHGLAAQGEAAVRRHLITDNLLRRQLTPLGKVRCYVGLLEELARERRAAGTVPRGELREHLARILKQSGRNVDRYLAVSRLPMPVQQAFDEGQLSLVEAARIATLDVAVQGRIAAAIGQGVPAREAVAGHLPAPSGRHRKVGDALAAFVRSLRRGLADLEGRVGQARPRGDDVTALETARGMIDKLLGRT
jgi:ParB/RepB/Spo0J family partition protein